LIGIVSMVYNGEEFIEEALDSLFYQSYKNWILAITDDGSTDGTKEILDEYSGKDKRIKVFHTKHYGVAPAFNNSLFYLLDKTPVRYIARLDADDYFLEQSLHLLRECLIDTGADLVHGDHLDLKKVNGRWMVTGQSFTPNEQPTSAQFIRGFNVISGGGILVRRDILEKLENPGWDIEMKGAWEMEWYIRILIETNAKFVKLNAPVYVHRFHEKSMFSESLSGRWLDWRKQLLERRPEYRKKALKVLGYEN